MTSTYRSGRRVAGVDVARGVALLGMMSVHVFPPTTGDGGLHPAYAVAAGRAAALFAVLAGVGLALMTGGRTPYDGARLRAARAGVLARAVLLLALGLLLGLVDSPPLVILAYYAVLFVVAVPFLRLPPGPLVALAVGWALLAPQLSHWLRATFDLATPVEEPGGRDVVLQLLLTGTYPVLPWVAYLLAGLAVGRLALGSDRVAALLAVTGLGLAVGARVLSGWLLDLAGGPGSLTGGDSAAEVQVELQHGLFGTTPAGDPGWLVVSAPHTGTTLDLVHTIGIALLVLGVCLLVTRGGPGLLLPLACTGSMTLTLYTLHVLALWRGWPVLVDDPAGLWLLHVAVALTLATAWRSAVGRGPLEALSAGLARAAGRATVRV